MKLYKERNPLVSIVLPTYNRGYLLNRAIKSVLDQTFQDFELIVVDDGSNDNTCEIINKYIESHQNIKYVKQQNMKQSLALNTGIQLSSGKYITFINSDDYYKPDHLKVRVDFFLQNPKVDLIHGGVEIIGNGYVKDKEDTSRLIHITECALGATFFGKKKVFGELGGFKILDYSEDSEFLERAEKMFVVEKKPHFKTYVYYRNADDSITNNV